MTINIFILKGELNGKIVVVRFFFCRVYLEFLADSSVKLTLPKLVYHSPLCVLFLHRERTDTHLRHTQVLVRFDQKLIFHDN